MPLSMSQGAAIKRAPRSPGQRMAQTSLGEHDLDGNAKGECLGCARTRVERSRETVFARFSCSRRGERSARHRSDSRP